MNAKQVIFIDGIAHQCDICLELHDFAKDANACCSKLVDTTERPRMPLKEIPPPKELMPYP